jgi:transglutaminase-like putative cysteine protease
MARWGWVLIVLCVAIPARPSPAATLPTEKTPDWVNPIAVPTGHLGDDTRVRKGVQLLLADLQMHVDDGTRATFVHSAYRIANRAGLDDWSNVFIRFDPAYESVSINQVSIIRDGKRINAIKSARQSIYEGEGNPQMQTYTGQRTLQLLLDDLRVGDIVEYSYVVTGENLALKGEFSQYTQLQWDLPVDRAYRRVEWGKTRRALKIRKVRGAPDPVRSQSGRWQEYVWDRADVPGVMAEERRPAWFEPFAAVELSDAEDWSEIVQVGMRLFRNGADESPALRLVADGIRAKYARPEDRLVAALHFVQDTIRYVAIAVGKGGYVPNPASLTLKRKYGDCKDKTVLLISLLRLLNIEGYPVLANTQIGPDLREHLPAITAFDHAIVMAKLNGVSYWLDGTLTDQEGDLAHLNQPDYGSMLVLAPETKDLVDRPAVPLEAATTAVYEDLDLSAGPEKPGQLTVRSVYTGADADWIRARLSVTALAEMDMAYLNYRAFIYGEVRSLGMPVVKRDDAANRVVVTESYEIARPWHRDDGRWVADYFAGMIYNALEGLGSANRRSPFGLAFPLFREEHFTLRLPRAEASRGKHERDEIISNPFFTLDYRVRTTGEAKTYHYTYRTLKDHVPVAALAAYKKDLDEALGLAERQSASYDTKPAGVPSSVAYGIAGFAVILLAGFQLRRRLKRTKRPPLMIYQIRTAKI